MSHRLAFLSTAHIHTRDFFRDLAGDAIDAHVYAVWDDTPERGRRYAEEAGAMFETDLDTLLGDDQVDGFVICDANTRHMAIMEKALAAGRPVFCEKPLTTTVADARRVAELVAAHDTPICCGYFLPFFAPQRGLKAAIDAGAFGRLTHAFARNSHSAAYGGWFDNPDLRWFTEKALSGGGALMDLGAHGVHLLRHLCGPAKSVWATTANISGVYPDVDDYGVMQITFDSGVIGRAEASWVQHSQNPGAASLEVWGDAAGLMYKDGEMVAHKGRDDRETIPAGEARPDRMNRFVALIDGTLDAAEAKEDFAACLDSVAIMAAAYRSAESGRIEEVERI